MTTLYLVGGTGGLGFEVAKGLVAAEGFAAKKALVRDVKKAAPLKDLGWTVVKVESMDAITKEDLVDAKVVVSTIGGGSMVALETAVIKAAKQAGASLFVPSQFGVDYRRWGTSFPFLAGKKQVLDVASQEGLATLCVFVGLFSDWIFDFLAKPVDGKVTIVGDGSAKVSFTRRSDIGFVLAKALVDPKYNQGGFLPMQGDCMSWKEALNKFALASGVSFETSTIDPQDALKEEQSLLKKGLAGDMGAFYGAFALHLLGEPARGNSGCDLSQEATNLGVKLETVDETLKDVYGSK